MNGRALWSIARSGRVGTLRELSRVMAEFTRATFLVAAARTGVLRALADGPRTLGQLSAGSASDEDGRQAFAAWLEVGVSLGELRHRGERYALRGALARALAHPEHDDVLAMLEELTSLHHALVLQTPAQLAAGRRFTLADQDGEVIARSSRMLEPFVEAALEGAVPRTGAPRVLEIGCGSGTYLRWMAARNPALRAVGLELQPEVAAQARRNLQAWGFAERVSVEVGDARTAPLPGPFDLITLHNNIYYFAAAERETLLRRLRGALAPGGKLLLTTATPGGSPSVAVLNLWGAMTAGCGALPTPEELLAVLARAGFGEARAENLAAPLERFYAFVATAP